MTVSPIQRFVFHLPALVLAVWGTVLLHVAVTGRVAQFLAPIFRPFVLLAGVALLLLAVGHVVWYQPAPPPRPRKNAEPVPASPLWFELGRWLVLLVPVVVAGVLAPNRYSERILLARGVQSAPLRTSTEDDRKMIEEIRQLLAKQPEGEPLPLSLYDIIALTAVPHAAEILHGQDVLVSGQFDPREDGSFRLVDIMVFCCAADAVPMGVTIHGKPPEGLEAMDWIDVTGTLTFSQKLGRHQVEMDATSIERQPPPDDVFPGNMLPTK